jgi:pyruvate,water dikinase
MIARRIFPLGSRRALQLEHSGGKAATLARLTRLGFAVPPGFVIASPLFDGLRQRCTAGAPTASGLEPEAMEKLHRQLLRCPLSPAETRRLGRAFRLFGGPVAVRSSFIGEDGAKDSYAGQLESVLGVDDEDGFLDAVRRVYASQFRGRLAHYRLARGRSAPAANLDSSSMSVLVQRMVDPIVSGVAFSSDPVSGRRRVVIEAATGGAGRVERGVVTPRRYVVGVRHELSGMEAGGGEAVLAPKRILELAELVRRIEAALGGPQDVEWAFDGERLHVLQSRPITSLAGRHIYSRRLLADMSPGLVTPLQWSTTTRSMVRHVFGELFVGLLGRRDIDPTRLITRLRSRIYGDMTLIGRLLAEAGLPINFFEMLSRDERARIRPRPTYRLAARAPRIAWCASRWLRMAGRAERCLAESREPLAHLRASDLSRESDEQLVAGVQRLLDLHGRLQWATVLGAMNLMGRAKLLRQLVERWAPGVDQRGLLASGNPSAAARWNQELEAMADAARGLGSDFAQGMSLGDESSIRDRLADTVEGRRLAAKMDEFLERFGFLSSDATDLSSPSWHEEPSLVWATVGRLAASPRAETASDAGTNRESSLRQVRQQLGPVRRRLLGAVWRSTDRFLDLRERLGLTLSESAYHLRRLFLAVGRRLVAKGVLSRPEEVFLLYWDEVAGLLDGSLEITSARRLVVERADELEADSRWEEEVTICGREGARDRPRNEPPADCLSGIGSSPGTASGRACVLRDPAAAPAELGRDHILVVPYTDVGWTPLLSRVGGVVAESGGALSHTSIIAREYGLPAVVGVERATSVIAEGESITVDGDRGRVCLDDRRADGGQAS